MSYTGTPSTGTGTSYTGTYTGTATTASGTPLSGTPLSISSETATTVKDVGTKMTDTAQSVANEMHDMVFPDKLFAKDQVRRTGSEKLC